MNAPTVKNCHNRNQEMVLSLVKWPLISQYFFIYTASEVCFFQSATRQTTRTSIGLAWTTRWSQICCVKFWLRNFGWHYVTSRLAVSRHAKRNYPVNMRSSRLFSISPCSSSPWSSVIGQAVVEQAQAQPNLIDLINVRMLFSLHGSNGGDLNLICSPI